MDTDNYTEFIKGLELNNIFLGELQARRISEPNEGHWVTNLKVDYSLETTSEEILIAKAVFNIKVLNEATEQQLFLIKVEFLINYSNKSKIKLTEEMEKRFTNTNLPLNIWPYAREIISNLSTRMGYPPLVIGTFKVF